MGTSGKRKESQTSSSSGKKPKASISRGFQGQGCDYQDQGQTRTPSQSEQITCYHCHQPGHVRRDCPQRQGSQGHGTPQSQPSVGRAQTQYVPSHPGGSQRNHYQSQGAAQEPSTTQTGS